MCAMTRRSAVPIRRQRCSIARAQAWLADVLARIADHPHGRLDEHLPWNWKTAATVNASAA
jgi:ABC-type ATPase involved in cell division